MYDRDIWSDKVNMCGQNSITKIISIYTEEASFYVSLYRLKGYLHSGLYSCNTPKYT